MEIKHKNTPQRIRLEVLTPLHIGAAKEKNWVKGMDYIERDGKTYHISQKKLQEELFLKCPETINTISKAWSEGNTGNALSIELTKRKIQLKDVSDTVFEQSTGFEVFSHTRQAGDGSVYIPGSSIKGAIRSILITHLLKGRRPFTENALRQEIESLMGTMDNNLMQFLQISDFVSSSVKTELYTSKIWNLHRIENSLSAGWKHGKDNTTLTFNPTKFSSTYECISSSNSLFGSINIKTGKQNFQRDKSVEVKTFPFSNIEDMFATINLHSKKYLEREIAFLAKYNELDESTEILKTYQNLQSKVDTLPKDACIFRMASGSGFHSITGDWRFKNHDDTGFHPNGKKIIKSRRFLFSREGNSYKFFPMGFVQLSISDVSEYQKVEKIAEIEKPIEVKKEIVPEFLKKNPNQGDVIDAILVKKEGAVCTFKLYLLEGMFKEMTLRYNADLALDKVYKIKVTGIQKGNIQSIGFSGEKK